MRGRPAFISGARLGMSKTIYPASPLGLEKPPLLTSSPPHLGGGWRSILRFSPRPTPTCNQLVGAKCICHLTKAAPALKSPVSLLPNASRIETGRFQYISREQRRLRKSSREGCDKTEAHAKFNWVHQHNAERVSPNEVFHRPRLIEHSSLVLGAELRMRLIGWWAHN